METSRFTPQSKTQIPSVVPLSTMKTTNDLFSPALNSFSNSKVPTSAQFVNRSLKELDEKIAQTRSQLADFRRASHQTTVSKTVQSTHHKGGISSLPISTPVSQFQPHSASITKNKKLESLLNYHSQLKAQMAMRVGPSSLTSKHATPSPRSPTTQTLPTFQDTRLGHYQIPNNSSNSYPNSILQHSTSPLIPSTPAPLSSPSNYSTHKHDLSTLSPTFLSPPSKVQKDLTQQTPYLDPPSNSSAMLPPTSSVLNVNLNANPSTYRNHSSPSLLPMSPSRVAFSSSSSSSSQPFSYPTPPPLTPAPTPFNSQYPNHNHLSSSSHLQTPFPPTLPVDYVATPFVGYPPFSEEQTQHEGEIESERIMIDENRGHEEEKSNQPQHQGMLQEKQQQREKGMEKEREREYFQENLMSQQQVKEVIDHEEDEEEEDETDECVVDFGGGGMNATSFSHHHQEQPSPYLESASIHHPLPHEQQPQSLSQSSSLNQQQQSQQPPIHSQLQQWGEGNEIENEWEVNQSYDEYDEDQPSPSPLPASEEPTTNNTAILPKLSVVPPLLPPLSDLMSLSTSPTSISPFPALNSIPSPTLSPPTASLSPSRPSIPTPVSNSAPCLLDKSVPTNEIKTEMKLEQIQSKPETTNELNIKSDTIHHIDEREVGKENEEEEKEEEKEAGDDSEEEMEYGLADITHIDDPTHDHDQSRMHFNGSFLHPVSPRFPSDSSSNLYNPYSPTLPPRPDFSTVKQQQPSPTSNAPMNPSSVPPDSSLPPPPTNIHPYYQSHSHLPSSPSRIQPPPPPSPPRSQQQHSVTPPASPNVSFAPSPSPFAHSYHHHHNQQHQIPTSDFQSSPNPPTPTVHTFGSSSSSPPVAAFDLGSSKSPIYEEHVRNLESELMDQREQIKILMTQKNQLELELSILQERMNDQSVLQPNGSNYSEQVAKLELLLQKKEKEIGQLNSQFGDLLSQFYTATQEKDSLKNLYDESEKNRHFFEEESSSLGFRLDELGHEFDLLQEELDATKEELKTTEKKLYRLQSSSSSTGGVSEESESATDQLLEEKKILQTKFSKTVSKILSLSRRQKEFFLKAKSFHSIKVHFLQAKNNRLLETQQPQPPQDSPSNSSPSSSGRVSRGPVFVFTGNELSPSSSPSSPDNKNHQKQQIATTPGKDILSLFFLAILQMIVLALLILTFSIYFSDRLNLTESSSTSSSSSSLTPSKIDIFRLEMEKLPIILLTIWSSILKCIQDFFINISLPIDLKQSFQFFFQSCSEWIQQLITSIESNPITHDAFQLLQDTCLEFYFFYQRLIGGGKDGVDVNRGGGGGGGFRFGKREIEGMYVEDAF